MEVKIVSRELIKPSSPAAQSQKPYKLCLLDQLTPHYYTPMILFYLMNPSHSTIALSHLKNSLSKTLNLYYPFCGRIRDDLYIDRFNEGVPFLEAQVNCRMSDFLRHHDIEYLNHFLPCQPFTKESDMNTPLLAVQVTMFTCGGIAVSMCASHKLCDGNTGRAFINTLASVSLGDLNGVSLPNLSEASLFFPPTTKFPQNHLSLMDSLWFTEGNYITRRFVFDAKAIAALRANAEEKLKARPSRIETISCFIWKCCMAASKAVSGSTKPSILLEAMNLRPHTKPPMSNSSIGNLFWWAPAVAHPNDTNTEMHELIKLASEAIKLYKSDFSQALQGDGGLETMSEHLNQLEELVSLEKADIFAFTSWCYLGLTKLNFGWGEPYWFAFMGKVGPAFRNLTLLIETKDGKGIEAWITLDKEKMSIVENDPEFLAFASSNPKISSL
ncbi:stemmadenine O-acetyltransferase [Manihot esculenta]|uniref:Uncharacterized protein n=1 Tax=Manihot esculenta TaxID=3983 RepID=A0A2C9V3I6_MANES|nr:stemmadenine O-acetyltransferase [Manihot esculenta]OAY38894.1 hypothetical protein MANES_10G050800v8 [Manihot esculenta]